MSEQAGTPIDLEKMRSIGFLGRGRTRPRITEGKMADDSGRVVRYKSTTDELNNTVRLVGSDRQDVCIRPEPIRLSVEELRNAGIAKTHEPES